MSNHTDTLAEASDHLDHALEHHAAGRHGAVKRRIELARAVLQRMSDELAMTNPTAEQGAQVSDGRSPRSFDPEVRRQQDQLRSCQIAYAARMQQMGVRR